MGFRSRLRQLVAWSQSHGPQWPSDVEMTEDDILCIFGGYGPYQRGMFHFGFLASIALACHHLLSIVLAPEIVHWCPRPDTDTNLSLAEWFRFRLPEKTGGSGSACEVYYISEGPSKNRTVVRCHNWGYKDERVVTTILDERDLVCAQGWLVSLSASVYMLGSFAGLMIFGNISDRIGRRPVIITATAVLVIAGIGVLSSTTFYAFLAFRILVGAGVIIVYETMFVLTMEVVQPDYRCYLGLGYHIGWGIGCMGLGIVGWLLHGWLYIQGFVMVPSVALLRGLESLSESPRWLLATGRFDRADHVVSCAIKKNLAVELAAEKVWRKLKLNLEQKFQERPDSSAPSAFHLLKTARLRLRTLIIFYTWFAISFTYYAISLNVRRLVGDVYISFILSGFVEIPAYGSTMYILGVYGRKTIQSATLFCSAFACAVSALLHEDNSWLGIVFTLLGKFMIAAAFGVVSVYSTEIFPTVLRGIGMCYSSIFARAATVVAPFVKELGDATENRVPYVLYAALCSLSGLLVLLLPETRIAILPDTTTEADAVETQVKQYPEGLRLPSLTATYSSNLEIFTGATRSQLLQQQLR